jgi:four helix bundle protein
MASRNRFEDLQIWQVAREYCKTIYSLNCIDAFTINFKLKNTIDAASGSIRDNIAAGFKRRGKPESILFLSIAKA